MALPIKVVNRMLRKADNQKGNTLPVIKAYYTLWQRKKKSGNVAMVFSLFTDIDSKTRRAVIIKSLRYYFWKKDI